MNVTLELQGHSITYDGDDSTIINNGILTIIDFQNVEEIDDTDISTIANLSGNSIENNNTLILGIDDEIVNTNSPFINGNITGNGNITIYDGNVSGNIEGTLINTIP